MGITCMSLAVWLVEDRKCSAKKHFNRFLSLYFVYLLFYFFICLSVIYTVNYFLRISGNMLHKKHVPMQNFPLYLKKAGLASRNIVHVQKTFYVVSVSAFIFFINFSNCKLLISVSLAKASPVFFSGPRQNSKQ